MILLALVSSSASPYYSQLKQRSFRRTNQSTLRRSIRIASVPLPNARQLITVGDTLYLVNAHGDVAWKWDVGGGEDIMDRPYVDTDRNIFGIADEGIVFSLDSNGKERWRWRMNGSYRWTQLKPYINRQYLIVLDASSYRKYFGYDEDDVLYLCRDHDVISTMRFPRNAKLRVRGSQIFAVVKNGIRRVHLAANAPNKSLDASGGSVFLNLIRPAMLD
jgi:hypothetical protein